MDMIDRLKLKYATVSGNSVTPELPLRVKRLVRIFSGGFKRNGVMRVIEITLSTVATYGMVLHRVVNYQPLPHQVKCPALYIGCHGFIFYGHFCPYHTLGTIEAGSNPEVTGSPESHNPDRPYVC